MLNRVILIGRLTQDPELRYTPNGVPVCRFTLAVNRKFNREETDFIDILVWRGMAENCAQYLSKGQMAAVEGRLQVRTYEGRDGIKRKAVEVVADDVRFLAKSGSASQGAAASRRPDSDPWSDIGEEISIEDLDIVDRSEDDEVPF
ncbi:single-strand binding protein [Thermosyntropha lipolytica DSM 11003]|uniref:Single-stranded DNA-binding protein n=1 Tax=Thermosyntropha lipolytica DSM 11003 TaxID=1123382 RepID=A0A1M5R611_9FIRM|nr:single-stranded DNA-binding protein [Thermosyntropha lipolytica]SHH21648.1 single-strand binding protein [Thermosyntropha lipolytica DSM 11003]